MPGNDATVRQCRRKMLGRHRGLSVVSLAFAVDQKGILPDHMIAALAGDGAILPAYDFVPDQIQPASLDLRLGEVAYRVRASFLPGPDTTVAERIDHLKLHEIALGDGAVLETGCVYIVPLIESLALPDHIAAAANPKSSTGRRAPRGLRRRRLLGADALAQGPEPHPRPR